MIRDKFFWLIITFSVIALTAVYQTNPSYTIHLASFFDDRIFVDNWHGSENSAGVAYRWSKARSSIHIPGRAITQGFDLTLHMESLPRADGQFPVVQLAENKQILHDIALGSGPRAYTVSFPAGTPASGELDLVSPTFRPPNDARDLGVKVDWLRIQLHRPGPGLILPPALPLVATILLVAGMYAFLNRLGLGHIRSFVGSAFVLVSIIWGLVTFTTETETLLPRFVFGLGLVHLFWSAVQMVKPERRGQRLYVLFGLGLLLAVSIRMVLTASAGTHPDVEEFYIPWGQKMVAGGPFAAYGGDKALDYPPALAYIFYLVSAPYAALSLGPLEASSATLVFLFRLPAVLCDLAMGLAIFLYRTDSRRVGVLSSLAFLLTPPLFLDSSFSGRTSSVYTLFVLLAFLALARGWKIGPLTFLAIGSWIKPQSWVFIPAVGLFALRRNGWGAMIRDGAMSLFLSFLLLLPVLLTGALTRMLNGIRAGFVFVTLVLSANAYNLWWLITNGNVHTRVDALPSLGSGLTLPIPYSVLATVLLAVVYLLAVAAGWKANSRSAMFEAAALIGFAVYMLDTGMVDNHMMHIFPFLALLLFENWQLALVFALLSLASAVNILLETAFVQVILKGYLPEAILRTLRWDDALLNTAVLLFWLLSFGIRRFKFRRPGRGEGVPVQFGELDPSLNAISD